MMIKRILSTMLLTLVLVFGVSTVVNAQKYDPLAQACKDNPRSSLCQPPADPVGPNNIFVKAAQVVVYITGILAVIMIIIGGFAYVTSNGDPHKLNGAKNTILYALIGIAVAVSAQLIINVVMNRVR